MEEKFTVLEGAKLIDGNGGTPVEDSILIIKDNLIEAVGKADTITIPQDADVIDITGKTVMPGMTDMHVHLYWNGEPDLALHNYKESTAFRSVKAVAYIQRSLEAGFTTLRSAGEVGYLDVALREAVKAGAPGCLPPAMKSVEPVATLIFILHGYIGRMKSIP